MRRFPPSLAFSTLLAVGVACGGSPGDGSTPAPAPPLPAAPPEAGTPPSADDAGPDASAARDAAPPDAHTPGDARVPDAAQPPDIDQIPWQTGANIGYGVATKDTQNPAGENLFIGYSGYEITLASAEAWVTALYRAKLEALGVRYVWAVQGPNDPLYANKEIGNSKIVATMLPLVVPATKFILVAGHSSGSFVAHEILDQLDTGLDPSGVTADKVVYFDLDGGENGLSQPVVARLRRAYFVGSYDGATSTYSPHANTMQSLGMTYASAGGYWQNDASGSGCNAGAQWCVHVTLITTKPHDPTNADPQPDYSDFAGRPVCHAYIDAKASEAGLTP